MCARNPSYFRERGPVRIWPDNKKAGHRPTYPGELPRGDRRTILALFEILDPPPHDRLRHARDHFPGDLADHPVRQALHDLLGNEIDHLRSQAEPLAVARGCPLHLSGRRRRRDGRVRLVAHLPVSAGGASGGGVQAGAWSGSVAGSGVGGPGGTSSTRSNSASNDPPNTSSATGPGPGPIAPRDRPWRGGTSWPRPRLAVDAHAPPAAGSS